MQRLILPLLFFSVTFTVPAEARPSDPPPEQHKKTEVSYRVTNKEKIMPSFLATDSGAQPQFQGRDISAFKCWVLQHLRFPAEGFAAGQTGSVMVSFTVSRKGKLTNVVIMPGSDKRFARYVAAQFNLSPLWDPAVQNGKPVGTKHIIGFDIELKPIADGFCSQDNTAYNQVDTQPVFDKGHGGSFVSWVKERVETYFGGDTAILKGTVPLEFVIEKDGSVAQFIVGKTPDLELAEVTGRIAATAPAWSPGIYLGEKVRVGMIEQIYFGESPAPDANAIYELVDMMPQFYGGGLEFFRNWVAKQVVYPDNALRKKIKGTVRTRFVVEKDGSVSNIEILSSPHQCLSDEVIRVLRSSAKWIPGVYKGKTVRVRYTLPVNFNLDIEPAPQIQYTRPRSNFGGPSSTPAHRY